MFNDEVSTKQKEVVMEEQDSPKFVALVTYTQPEFEELKRLFPAHVDPSYKSYLFNPIEICKAIPMDVMNCEVSFEYVHLSRREFSADKVLAEMDSKGLRPALYEELLSFAEKYPDEQQNHPIVALGSESCVNGNRYIAYLWGGEDGRRLCWRWIDGGWRDYYRFLAVRK